MLQRKCFTLSVPDNPVLDEVDLNYHISIINEKQLKSMSDVEALLQIILIVQGVKQGGSCSTIFFLIVFNEVA